MYAILQLTDANEKPQFATFYFFSLISKHGQHTILQESHSRNASSLMYQPIKIKNYNAPWDQYWCYTGENSLLGVWGGGDYLACLQYNLSHMYSATIRLSISTNVQNLRRNKQVLMLFHF